jgi:hypothetical protein
MTRSTLSFREKSRSMSSMIVVAGQHVLAAVHFDVDAREAAAGAVVVDDEVVDAEHLVVLASTSLAIMWVSSSLGASPSRGSIVSLAMPRRCIG